MSPLIIHLYFLSAIVKSYSPLMSLLLMSFTTYFEP
jgi:hypothetical protein